MRDLKTPKGLILLKWDLLPVHIGGPDVTATAVVHVPTRRFIADWVTENEVILGDSVDDMLNRGYSVTALVR